MDYHTILDGLIVGSCPQDAADVARLGRKAGVRAVLNLQTDEDFTIWRINWRGVQRAYEARGLRLARVPIRDFDPLDLRTRLAVATEALDRLMQSYERVYTHCTAGIGRAPAVAIAWLAWYRGLPLERAVEYVTGRRPCSPFVEAIALATQDRLGAPGASTP